MAFFILVPANPPRTQYDAAVEALGCIAQILTAVFWIVLVHGYPMTISSTFHPNKLIIRQFLLTVLAIRAQLAALLCHAVVQACHVTRQPPRRLVFQPVVTKEYRWGIRRVRFRQPGVVAQV